MSQLLALAHPLMSADDPLYNNGVGWIVFLIVVLIFLAYLATELPFARAAAARRRDDDPMVPAHGDR